MKRLLQWTIIIPLLAWGLFFSGFIYDNNIVQVIASILLILSVMSSVHHSEIIAHRVGEPYGTIILAIAITVIEVSIIISLMVSGGEESVSLARDTVYSATMGSVKQTVSVEIRDSKNVFMLSLIFISNLISFYH